MNEILTSFLLYFTGVFTAVNPMGTLPVFSTLTEDMRPSRARCVALRVSLVAGLALIFMALFGEFLFHFFHISLDSLRVVGGILLGILGYDMIQAKISRTKNLSAEEQEEINSIAITPLAIPMVCGPGAITVSVLLFQDVQDYWQKALVIFSIVAAALANFAVLASAPKINRLLGESGRNVVTRLMGLIIMMIAVEYFFAGLKNHLGI